MDNFDACIEKVLDHEGDGFVAEDYGRGPSKWGVTLKSYLEFKPDATAADIAALTRETAKPFYRAMFWDRYGLGGIANQLLAYKVLDVGVNIGGGTAIRLLQRTIGVTADGILGPRTVAAVNATLPGETLGAFRLEAARYYRAVAEAHPERAQELPGWLARLEKA